MKVSVEQIDQRLVSVYGGQDIVVRFQVRDAGTSEDRGTIEMTLQVFVDGAVRWEVRNSTDLENIADLDSILAYFEEVL